MKFVVDAQLPPGLCDWLAERGHQAAHVHAVLPGQTPDIEIAAYAEREEAILVSKDEDFLMLRLPDRFALLWLRCGNTTNRALAAWLEARWGRIETLLHGGERLVEVR